MFIKMICRVFSLGILLPTSSNVEAKGEVASIRAIAQFALALIVIGIAIGPSAVSAGAITISLSEADFFGITTQDPGAIHVGTLDVPTFAPTPNSQFKVEEYSITIPDESGNDIFLSDSVSVLTGIGESAEAYVTTDSNGDPDLVIGITPSGGIPFLFVSNPITIVSSPDPIVSYSLGLTNSSNPTTPFWSLNPFTLPPNSSPPFEIGDFFRLGTYELTAEDANAVPEPSSLALLALGGACLAFGRRIRKRKLAASSQSA